MWWLPHNFAKKKPHLYARMQLIRSIRRFFDGRDFLAVETPALQVCPTVDTHIHGCRVDLRDVNLNHLRTMYLHTSPEFPMKKLLVAGAGDIYQICQVYRDGEDTALHSPEFTMIEWYRTGADYRAIMEDCQDLLRTIATDLNIKCYRFKGAESDPFLKWNIISVAEAFEKYVNINISEYLDDCTSFARVIAEQGIRTAPDDRWDDLFFRVMAEKIEPHLGVGAPCILYDYPASMAALSRKKPDDPRFAERFELYICGVELANAFSELTDADEQRARFAEDMEIKEEIYGERYPFDEDFLKALEHGLPPCAGIALGIDRLAMLASGAEDIEQVLWTGKP